MNETLKKLFAQLAAIWRELGLNQRISVVLGAVIVLVALGSLAFWSSRVDYALLFGKLDDTEAAKVIAYLDESKIPYQTSQGGGSIAVPRDKVYSVRAQLALRGVPRGEGAGFDLLDKPNFGISDFIQHANWLRAVQGELARTISQFDGVASTRVMIVVPENRLLLDNQKKPTASVFLTVKGSAPLAAQTVNAIRNTVANSVEGLQTANVSVVDQLGNVLTPTGDQDSAAAIATTQLASRRAQEEDLAKKAESLLEKVLGPRQAVVRVALDINWDSGNRFDEKFDAEGAVPRHEDTTDDKTDSTTATSGGGTPGVSANTGESNAVAAAGSPVNNSKVTKKTTTKEYAISRTVTSVTQSPGDFKRMTAAVSVAAKFEGEGKDRKVVARSPEELEKLRRIVISALGLQIGPEAKRKDELTLEEMSFNDPSAELAQLMHKEETKLFWLGLGRQLIYPTLAIAVLCLFWRAFKRTTLDNIPIGVPVGQMANGEADVEMNPHGEWQAKPRRPEAVTVKVLNQLIRENPDNITQALNTWMARNE